MNIKAENDTIVRVILTEHDKFRIPIYQRPYSWGIDQVEDFWNDLVSDTEEYFLGSIILNYEFKSETSYIDIVDGQQRILTIMLFLAALRDVAEDVDKSLAETIHNKDILVVVK